jgi:hypothetical protein
MTELCAACLHRSWRAFHARWCPRRCYQWWPTPATSPAARWQGAGRHTTGMDDRRQRSSTRSRASSARVLTRTSAYGARQVGVGGNYVVLAGNIHAVCWGMLLSLHGGRSFQAQAA